MFTGIIEQVGVVRSLEGSRLVLACGADDWRPGESVAVNGCCLTVLDIRGDLAFDLSEETLQRTALGSLSVGEPVNIERAMRGDGRFGGHMVSGHVDGIGRIEAINPQETGISIRFSVPPEGAKYLIDKGSIAVDGISLTVVDPVEAEFEVWVIPHTLANTALASRRVGDAVNIEFDMVAKYLERLVVSG